MTIIIIPYALFHSQIACEGTKRRLGSCNVYDIIDKVISSMKESISLVREVGAKDAGDAAV